jgi:AraC family transcriptional regulator of adaptative response / DNA-3-methyladenine glycosylase II
VLGSKATIAVPEGFAWEATLGFLRTRALRGIEQITEESYSRVLDVSGRLVEVSRDPATRQILVRCLPDLSAPDDRVLRRVRALFDVAADGRAVRAHLARSPHLREVLRGVADLRVPGCWDPFELAVRAVLGQQVSVAAASTLMARLIACCGQAAGGGFLFPDPATLAEADLSGIGLTRSRMATLRALAQAVADGRALGNGTGSLEQVVAELCAIPGIGPWTAHYVALRGLGHPDAFPVSDLGLRRAAGGSGGPLALRELTRRAEEWRPWRSYAAIALWQYEGRQGKGGG